ncbi:hypothetical protein [Streptomyces antimycoticus]|uniref:hypothetical protein n=1 Tax=Streptomyces antimycoticus TaxID=68175 RepID=UPI0036F01060
MQHLRNTGAKRRPWHTPRHARAPFSEGERHVRRIEMLSDYERTGKLPQIPVHHPQQD